MYVMKHLISILTDFMTSHKITFYTNFYDMDFFEMSTHDRTYISLYNYVGILAKFAST